MSRLTKEQAMSLYGRHLPTPTIEKMTLSDVKIDDDFLKDLAEMASLFPEGASKEDTKPLEDVRAFDTSTTTRVDLDISFYFQTWEGFDVNELTRELFEEITTSPGDTGNTETGNGLFINAAVTFPSSPSAGDKAPPLKRKNKLDLLSMFYGVEDRSRYSIFERLDLDAAYRYQNQYAAMYAMGPITSESGTQLEYEVSLPLSEFYEVAQLTAEYDADDNPIIKVSNIKLTFYINYFARHPNVTFYAAVSTAAPIALGSRSPLDAVSYSLNFSELTYEELVKNGSIATMGEPVFIDSAGVYYPNMPLRALNKKYYKIDEYGPQQIIDQTNKLLGEYRPYLATDVDLLDAYNQIKTVVQVEQDDINFLLLMEQLGQVYSETSEASRYDKFYQRYRILIKNADALLRNQQEVVKRIFRNYKVLDARAYKPPPMDASSFVNALTEPADFLYEEILHSNVANFVPIDAQPAEYPGKAEMPSNPSELLDAFSEIQEELRREMIELLVPSDTGGLDWSGADDVGVIIEAGDGAGVSATDEARALPWESRNALMANARESLYAGNRYGNRYGAVDYTIADVNFSQEEISSMLGNSYKQDNPLDRAVLRMTWWAYHMWAGRLIQGSEHKAYRANDSWDGNHWYVTVSQVESADYQSYFIRSKYPEWTNLWGVNTEKVLPPARWQVLVKHLSPGENDYENVVETSVNKGNGMNHSDYFDQPNQYSDVQGVSATELNARTISVFCYDPTAHPGAGSYESTDGRYGRYGSPQPSLPHSYHAVGDSNSYLDGNLAGFPAFWYFSSWSEQLSGNRSHTIGHGTHWDSTTGEERSGYFQYYLNTFFWTPASSKQVWAIHSLGQLEEQITFWVPTSGIGQGTREIDTTDIIDQTDEFFGAGEGMGFDESQFDIERAGEYLGSGDTLFGEGRGLYPSINERYERVGGIKAIVSARPRLAGSDDPYIDRGSYFASGWPSNPESDIPYTCIKRRKLKNIYRDVRRVVMGVFGMDNDGTEIGDGVAGGPEAGDASSTNAFTTLDTYLQEVPGLVVNEATNKLFDRLDNLPYGDFDTMMEVTDIAYEQADLLTIDYMQALSKYFTKNLCQIFMSTTLAGYDTWYGHQSGIDNMRNIPAFDKSEYASGLSFHQFDGYYLGNQSEVNTVLPFGEYNLPIDCQVKGVSYVAADTHRWSTTAKTPTRAQRLPYEVFQYDFGEAIKATLKDHFLRNLSQLRSMIQTYMQRRQNFESFQSDVGIHSSLAEVDIVLNKYGYFFFDMEKYIRKRSLMSTVINVDRLIGYMDSGQEMTNAAVRLSSAQIELANFGERGPDYPMSPIDGAWRHWGPPMPKSVQIVLDNDLDSAPYSPHNFQRMLFFSIYDETVDPPKPIVYNRIQRISEIRFSQISGYPNDPDAGGTGAEFGYSATKAGGTADTGPGGGGGGGPSPLGVGQQAGAGMGDYDSAMGMGSAGGSGDYSAYSTADADAARTDRQVQALQGREVNIDAVMEAHPPEDVNTKLILRNFAFKGFSNTVLNAGATWNDNYRLMCFKYQFFIDDDLAYNNDAHEEYNDTLKSVDDVRIKIVIKDNSKQVVYALASKYFEELRNFMPYLEDAKENCAFDAFDQKFNKFFADAMLEKYKNPAEQPWYRMVATYVTIYNLFSDTYAGNRARMQESANNMLEMIRPETGTLSALIQFGEACEVLMSQLKEAQVTVGDATNGFSDTPADIMVTMGEAFASPATTPDPHGLTTEFVIHRTLATPVIDHIGDYTSRAEQTSYPDEEG